MVEVFAGCGNLSRHLQRAKVPTVAWDVLYGSEFDLMRPCVWNVLRGWIVSGKVMAVWLGTPSEGLSRARRAPQWSRMPHALRAPDAVRGLPGLSGKDAETLHRSNFLADKAQRIMELAWRLGIPGGRPAATSGTSHRGSECASSQVCRCEWSTTVRAVGPSAPAPS